MRRTALLGCVVLFAGCSRKEAAPPDTTAAAMEAPAAVSLASLAGVWNVRVMPEGRDTTLTTYVLNTTDTAAWMFAFPNRSPIPMRVTGIMGDSVMTEAGPFESNLRQGVQVRTSGTAWIQDGKLVGRTTARYETTGADSVVTLRIEGTRQ